MKRKSGSQRQFPDREVVEALRRQYPAGTRVELISMDDPYTKLRPGDKGFVRSVDDTGTTVPAFGRSTAWTSCASFRLFGSAALAATAFCIPRILRDMRINASAVTRTFIRSR